MIDNSSREALAEWARTLPTGPMTPPGRPSPDVELAMIRGPIEERVKSPGYLVERLRQETRAQVAADLASSGVPDSSWSEVDLTDYLTNTDLPHPTVMARDDGRFLLYPGETAWVFGEPAAGKTWFAAYASAQCVQNGEHVVWLDFEGQGRAAVSRLILLGCTPDQLRACFHLVEPESALMESQRDQLDALTAYMPSLVVFDAANDVLTMQGGRLNDVDTIAKFDMLLLLPFKRAGAAVVVIDHVAKSSESRGLWPVNSGHKKACCSVAYSISAQQQFRPDRDGSSKIVVAKDRHGNVPAAVTEIAGYLAVRDGRFTVTGSLNMAELARAAMDAPTADHLGSGVHAAVIAAVSAKPGAFTMAALATELSAELSKSDKTVRRAITAALEQTDAAIERRDSKLWPVEAVEDAT